LLVGVIYSLSPFLGKEALVWFVDASAFGIVITYFMVILSFIAFRYKEPKSDRPYIVPKGKIMGIIAVIVSGLFIFLYLLIGSVSSSLVCPQEW